MRAAGIREIKNKLSEFLRLVAEGETVLVTDRGRVVAQLAPPPAAGPPALTEDEALRRLAAAGKLRLARSNVPSPGAGAAVEPPTGLDTDALWAEVRDDGDER